MTEGKALQAWLQRLETRHPVKWDLGLERVGRVAERLDALQAAKRILLVAGTNGKGSACEYVTCLAMASGLGVGLSTSPHLHRFNERIRVQGQPATDEQILAAFEAIETARADISLSYFEFGALASLLIFKQAGLDLAVLEIGLGGRLDAMNIVAPDLAIITSISLDHQAWLGPDREAIGKEKAGILRPGIPCVLADPEPPASVLAEARRLATPLSLLGRDFGYDPGRPAGLAAAGDAPVSLLDKGQGASQAATGGAPVPLPSKDAGNGRGRGRLRWRTAAGEPCSLDAVPEPALPPESLAAAVQAGALLGLDTGADCLRRLAADTRLGGRNQLLPGRPDLLADVAHNPAAAARFAGQVARLAGPGRRVLALAGIYADKDLPGVLAPFLPLVTRWYFCGLPEERAASADLLAEALSASAARAVGAAAPPAASQVARCANIASAVSQLLAHCGPDDLVIAFGSFPLVSGALQLFSKREGAGGSATEA